jgi:predicted transposase YbfD/YdcC
LPEDERFLLHSSVFNKEAEEWAGLRSLVCIKSTRFEKGESNVEMRYYISSLMETAENLGEVIRKHWSVENKLHWQLDVTFKEDKSKIHAGNGAENFSLLKRCVLNLIYGCPSL